jgi:hypothetical protein
MALCFSSFFSSRRAATLGLLPLLGLVGGSTLGSGCVVNSRAPSDPYGDIAFEWSFAGETSCSRAGVDEVDIVVLENNIVVDEIKGEPCIGGGLILTDFLEGRYDVFIDAYDRADRLLYTGDFTVRVRRGQLNDVGLVRLDAGDGRPVTPDTGGTGTLGFFWSFLYPTDAPIIDCAVAGVEHVEFILQRTDATQADIIETMPCTSNGAVISNLPAGAYVVVLDGWGRFEGQDLLLYTREVEVRVRDNRSLDLGDVPLSRVEASFGDLEVAWTIAEGCAAAGVAQVDVSVQRSTLAIPEDSFTVDCTAVLATRQTFVPGAYVVTVVGQSATTTYTGQQTLSLPPDQVGSVTVALTPA